IVDATNDNQPPAPCGDELSDPLAQVWQTTTYHPSGPLQDFCDFRNLYYKTYVLNDPVARPHFQNTMCEHGIICGGQVAVGEGGGHEGFGLSLPRPTPFTREAFMGVRVPAGLRSFTLTVDVYDVTGALVARLFSGTASAEQILLRWDGHTASG